MRTELKPYDEYKQADLLWLDSIPTHWEVVKNNSLWAERKTVNCLNEDLLSVTIKKGIIRQSDLLKSTSKKDSSNIDKSKYKLVMPEDIAYNKMRMWQGAVGKSKYRGIVSPAYIVIRPIADINTEYYHYLLRTPHYIEESHKYSYGICDDQLNLRYEDFKRMQIVVPPKDEQDQIVRYLDISLAKINKFIKTKKKLIEVLKEQKQAVINKAVTKGLDPNVKMKRSGIEWLGEIPEEWRKCKLKNIGSFKSGTNLTSLDIEAEGLFPVYGGNGLRGYYNKATHNGEYLLIGRQGALCGNVHLVKGEFWATEHAVVVTTEKYVDINWAKYLIDTMNLNQYSQSAAQPGLAVEKIINIPTILPPIETQQEIATFLEQKTEVIDNTIVTTQREIDLITEYRTRLISDVVTGKVDVRGIVIDDVSEDLEDAFDEELQDEESLSDEDGDENAN